MIRSEAHRQYYLASAGIRLWYARQPLPGAAPSPEYHFDDAGSLGLPEVPAELEALSPPAAVKPSAARPARQRPVDLQALMTSPEEETATLPSQAVSDADVQLDQAAELATETGAAKESVGPSTKASKDEGAQPVIAVNLAIWHSESYLLISEWSAQASERLQDRLARNLLGALHQNHVGERQVFHWPVFRNPNIPGNSAGDFPDALSRAVSSKQNKSVLLLGILNEYKDGQRQYCLSSVLPSAGVDFPYSLAELSSAAGLKRDLWATLKNRYSV